MRAVSDCATGRFSSWDCSFDSSRAPSYIWSCTDAGAGGVGSSTSTLGQSSDGGSSGTMGSSTSALGQSSDGGSSGTIIIIISIGAVVVIAGGVAAYCVCQERSAAAKNNSGDGGVVMTTTATPVNTVSVVPDSKI